MVHFNFVISHSKLGRPRPIEIHAHDPQRYVSDMSAWIHQSLASEAELITTLLKKIPKGAP